jgi:hypothetical protein
MPIKTLIIVSRNKFREGMVLLIVVAQTDPQVKKKRSTDRLFTRDAFVCEPCTAPEARH